MPLIRRSRRAVLASGAAFVAMPSISRAASRPSFNHGVQSGDVDTTSGMLWTRTDRPAKGREVEVADLLRFIKTAGVENTVWLTADVHYTAAHYYDPNAAQFSDFEPFWEFVSGPLHAGSFGPNALDNTFGPEVKFVKAPPEGQVNLPPSMGLQFFGLVDIDGATQQMTVRLMDRADTELYRVTLDPVGTSI
ncbi:alkaline phosphatase D family protein [Ruegeria jejuensis]|uniref:alkaline phosphatase D family protein n=1 Tax=Ruegeria jejuensis TaxID=3233338 RepID=UPI00355B8DED